jgi:hypothetical protein
MADLNIRGGQTGRHGPPVPVAQRLRCAVRNECSASSSRPDLSSRPVLFSASRSRPSMQNVEIEVEHMKKKNDFTNF